MDVMITFKHADPLHVNLPFSLFCCRKKEREKNKEKKRQRFEEAKKKGVEEVSFVTKKRKMNDPEASQVQVAIDCAFEITLLSVYFV